MGFFLWTLGAGLKLLFTRSTNIAVYIVVLAIEGAGVGFGHQPGTSSRSYTSNQSLLTSES